MRQNFLGQGGEAKEVNVKLSSRIVERNLLYRAVNRVARIIDQDVNMAVL